MLSPDKWDTVYDMPTRVRLMFEQFLASKPADEKYNWANFNRCACAQFIKASGFRDERGWFARLFRPEPTSPEEGHVWATYNSIAGQQPFTFGALLERVRALP